jgi:uroporphyrinogen decarboxylase
MNSRERVLRAFKVHEGLPDRIPVQFDLCRKLQDHFGKKLGIPSKYTPNLFEDVTYRISGNEIRLAMGSDVVIVGAQEAASFKIEKSGDGTWRNEYQMKMRQGSLYVDIIEFPLKDAETKADIDAYHWPDPHDPSRYIDAEYYINKYKNDYVIIGDIEVTIMSLAQQLVGIEKMMVDMAMDEEHIVYLFEKAEEFQTKIGLELIKRGVDAIWLGDDFGSQNGLLFSKEMFRAQLKPYYVRMLKTFKEANPNIIPILHCDGAVKDLLGDIKEMGIDVFNPVQPGVPGHGPQELKDGFGSMFAFWGAIDQQYLIPNGTDAELEADIKEKIAILGKGGGYMISPAHILQPDVSPERVEFFISACKKHGAYF